MRLSADKLDPFFSYCSRYAKVIFNGKEEKYVITACEENGLIVCSKIDKQGSPVLLSDESGIETIVKYGSVEINVPNKILLSFPELKSNPVFYGHFKNIHSEPEHILWQHNPTLSISAQDQYAHNKKTYANFNHMKFIDYGPTLKCL
jgi:hypothetical protein